jgi:hypothetical protein
VIFNLKKLCVVGFLLLGVRLLLLGTRINGESVCLRPHPKVHKTMGSHTRTMFPLLIVHSIKEKKNGEDEGSKKDK